MKCDLKVWSCTILFSTSWTPTFGADSDNLVRILAKANIAYNFVVYCAQYDPSIIGRTRSNIGDAQQLMEPLPVRMVMAPPHFSQ